MTTVRSGMTPNIGGFGSNPSPFRNQSSPSMHSGSPHINAGVAATSNSVRPIRRSVNAIGSSSPSGASNENSSSAPPELLPLPDAAMSCHARLALHLDDYVHLVDQLFESFDPTISGTLGSSAPPTASPSAAAAAAHATEAIMERLVRKDQLLQESVQKLQSHQALARELKRKWREVEELDSQLVAFCSHLGTLEAALLEAASPDADLVKGIGGKPLQRQQFRAKDVTIFAQKLARMSFAPADHLEKKAVLHESVTRPPAPLEKLMAGSMLHLSPEELNEVVEAEAKARAEAIEAKTAGGDAMEVDSFAHMPGSIAALGRQESVSSQTAGALPSFAELAQGGGTSTSTQPTQLWRQESAQRAMANAAPVALDLDLESSDSEEEDE